MSGNDKTPPDGHDLFGEAEIELIPGPTLDEKLDKIIALLEKNEQENSEIKDRLVAIEDNQSVLKASYQQHGKALGELMARVDELWKRL